MFKTTKATEKILEGGSLNKRELAAMKRQKVYDRILNGTVNSGKDLAEAAGYDMHDVFSSNYKRGSAFVHSLLKHGYIEKMRGRDGLDVFFIGSKEEVQSAPKASTVMPPKHVENLDDYNRVRYAEEKLQEAVEEYEEDQMGPEGQPKEDWATDDPIDDFPEAKEQTKLLSGSVELSGDTGVSFKITFDRKTRSEIIDIINNINTEFLL